MCLIIDQNIHNILNAESKPFIAQHNILVFKQLSIWGIFKKKYVTPYMDYPVKFDHGIAKIGISHPICIDAFTKFKFCVKEGIHSIRKYELWNDFNPYKMFLAIIPKGAGYYVGEHNDIVSDSLIIFKNRKIYLKFLEENNSIIAAEELYG